VLALERTPDGFSQRLERRKLLGGTGSDSQHRREISTVGRPKRGAAAARSPQL